MPYLYFVVKKMINITKSIPFCSLLRTEEMMLYSIFGNLHEIIAVISGAAKCLLRSGLLKYSDGLMNCSRPPMPKGKIRHG